MTVTLKTRPQYECTFAPSAALVEANNAIIFQDPELAELVSVLVVLAVVAMLI